jgi:hypothetical protein
MLSYRFLNAQRARALARSSTIAATVRARFRSRASRPRDGTLPRYTSCGLMPAAFKALLQEPNLLRAPFMRCESSALTVFELSCSPDSQRLRIERTTSFSEANARQGAMRRISSGSRSASSNAPSHVPKSLRAAWRSIRSTASMRFAFTWKPRSWRYRMRSRTYSGDQIGSQCGTVFGRLMRAARSTSETLKASGNSAWYAPLSSPCSAVRCPLRTGIRLPQTRHSTVSSRSTRIASYRSSASSIARRHPQNGRIAKTSRTRSGCSRFTAVRFRARACAARSRTHARISSRRVVSETMHVPLAQNTSFTRPASVRGGMTCVPPKTDWKL